MKDFATKERMIENCILSFSGANPAMMSGTGRDAINLYCWPCIPRAVRGGRRGEEEVL